MCPTKWLNYQLSCTSQSLMFGFNIFIVTVAPKFPIAILAWKACDLPPDPTLPNIHLTCGSHRWNQIGLFCPVKMTLVISLASTRSLWNCTALSLMRHLSFTVASATNKSTALRIFLLAWMILKWIGNWFSAWRSKCLNDILQKGRLSLSSSLAKLLCLISSYKKDLFK